MLRLYLALAALLSLAVADVQFTGPAAGASISGTTLNVQWKDSGASPSLSSFQSYQLFLCAGGNDPSSISVLATLTSTGDYSAGNSFAATFQPTLGGASSNAYFLKMISTATGGTVINYSSRFSLTSMTGTFSAAVQNALSSVSGTAGPASQNQMAGANGAGSGAASVAGGFGVAYSLQTGPTRYAPMPKKAGTSITMKNPTPQYATSAWTPYLKAAGTPNAAITVTQAITWGGTSVEPTFAAAPMPSDTDMQKFLNRWKD